MTRPLFNLDSAAWCAGAARAAWFHGWAFQPGDDHAATIRVVAGGDVSMAECNRPRPDVRDLYPDCPAAGDCGFSFRAEIGDAPECLLELGEADGKWTTLARLDCATFAAAPTPPEYTYRPLDWDTCRQRLREGQRLRRPPLISVVMPTYNTPPGCLRAAIDSVRNQLYEHWQLCIADDASPDPQVRRILEQYAALDSRIHIAWRPENGNISRATNTALALASGEFVALLDHDDELTPDALLEIAICLEENPLADIVYSDHDKIDEAGRCSEPLFKPAWSPEYFRGVMYVGHLLCVRRRLLEAVGGFDPANDGVQDYEAMLRLSERTPHIHHVPKVLYHWRMIPGSFATAIDAKPGLEHLQAKAVDAQLARLGYPARAETFGSGHRVRLKPAPRSRHPTVSIIIPTKDAPDYLERCLRSVWELSTYPRMEVLLGDNGTTDARALGIMESYPCRRIPCPGTFNFSRVNNLCAREAAGDFLVLLNNDTEVVTPDWIEQMLFHAEQPDAGAIGPLLLYPDRSVQHAGVILGPRGTADHLMRGFPSDADGYAGSLAVAREVSVVTAACLLVSKADFERAGGLNEHYFTHYQDTDFCLTLRRLGRRNVFTPEAVLIHHESASRKGYYDLIDRNLLLDRWADCFDEGDPFYNRNFDPAHHDYRLPEP